MPDGDHDRRKINEVRISEQTGVSQRTPRGAFGDPRDLRFS